MLALPPLPSCDDALSKRTHSPASRSAAEPGLTALQGGCRLAHSAGVQARHPGVRSDSRMRKQDARRLADIFEDDGKQGGPVSRHRPPASRRRPGDTEHGQPGESDAGGGCRLGSRAWQWVPRRAA